MGTTCLTTRRIGGANRPTTSEVTHIDPPRTWGVRGIDGPIRATVDVTVEPLADTRSRLTIAVDFEGHGIGKLLVPLVVRGAARKEMPANLATLKGRLEADTSSTTLRLSSAAASSSREYADPSRLQATRSALGATAAVGSICSSVRWRTTSSRSVGRRSSRS